MNNENINSNINTTAAENTTGENPGGEKEPAPKKRTVWFILAALFAAAGILSFIAKVKLPLPALNGSALLFISLSVSAVFLGIGFKRSWLKMLSFCLVAVFAAFTVVEIYLNVREQNQPGQTNDENALTTSDGVVISADNAREFFTRQGIETSPDAITEPHMNVYDELLGYRVTRDASEVLAVKLDGDELDDELIYAVKYHLNEDGWRVTPQYPEATKAVVFLGDSFTFGLGLNDEDTYPYKTGIALGSDYQVFNYGIAGWGTHQPLAMIENGWFDDICSRYDKVYFFYMPIDHHMERNVGNTFWDENGPSYELLEDGTVEYLGPFSAVKDKQWEKGRLFGKLGEEKYKEELMTAMVRQMHRVLEEEYGASLTLLRPFYNSEFLNALAAEGIDVLHKDLVPVEDYFIPKDGHPNTDGTTVFANQAVDYLLNKN